MHSLWQPLSGVLKLESESARRLGGFSLTHLPEHVPESTDTDGLDIIGLSSFRTSTYTKAL
jgi:hypothetical protein